MPPTEEHPVEIFVPIANLADAIRAGDLAPWSAIESRTREVFSGVGSPACRGVLVEMALAHLREVFRNEIKK